MVGMVDLVDLGTEGVKQMVTEVVEGAAIMEEEMEDILVAWLVPVQAGLIVIISYLFYSKE